MAPEVTPGMGAIHLWQEITVATYIEWGWIRGALRVVIQEEPPNPIETLVGCLRAALPIV